MAKFYKTQPFFFNLSTIKKSCKSLTCRTLFFVVPGAGVEPARILLHWCLRPARLPIPPSGLKRCKGREIFWNYKEFCRKLCKGV